MSELHLSPDTVFLAQGMCGCVRVEEGRGGRGGEGGGWHATSILQFNKIIIPAAVVTIAPCFAHEQV